MIWSAAPLGAALRVMRTAAGRRALRVALQLTLLVGGLFALGFLCGEQAHAAEGGPTATVAGLIPPSTPGKTPTVSGSSVLAGVGAVVRSSVDTVVHPVGPSRPPGAGPSHTGPAKPPPVASASSDPLPLPLPHPHPHSHRHPVKGLVDGLADGLAEVEAQLPQLGSLPALPVLPSLPALPSLPSLPTLPTIPSAPPSTVPASGGSVVQPSGAAQGTVPSGTATDRGTRETVYGSAAVAYGPRVGAGVTGEGAARGAVGHVGGAVGQAPARQAPGDDSGSGGALGNQPAVDNGGSRHVDVHAVSPDPRAPLRLVLGVVVRTDMTETKDRYRDIPVFPG
jgi:hypothetical protein